MTKVSFNFSNMPERVPDKPKGAKKTRLHLYEGYVTSQDKYAVTAKKITSPKEPKLNWLKNKFYVILTDENKGVSYEVSKASLKHRFGISSTELKAAPDNSARISLIEKKLNQKFEKEGKVYSNKLLQKNENFDELMLVPKHLREVVCQQFIDQVDDWIKLQDFYFTSQQNSTLEPIVASLIKKSKFNTEFEELKDASRLAEINRKKNEFINKITSHHWNVIARQPSIPPLEMPADIKKLGKLAKKPEMD